MPPRRICELAFPEQMLVWTARRWRQGHASWERAWPDFVNAFGPLGAETFTRSISGLLLVFRHARTTPERVGALHCPSVAPDEEDLIALMRYLHHRMDDAADALLEPHLPAAARRLAMTDAREAAAVMDDWGYHVPFPHHHGHGQGSGHGPRPGVTLH